MGWDGAGKLLKNPIRRWTASYDGYLKWKAVSPSSRDPYWTSREVIFPWFIAFGLLGLLIAGLTDKWPYSRPVTFVFISTGWVGGVIAGFRYLHHRHQAEITPASNAGFNSKAGKVLVDELRLSGAMSSRVNADMSLVRKLGLNRPDIAGLLNALQQHCEVEALDLPPGPYAPGGGQGGYTDLTPRMLMEAMERTPRFSLDARREPLSPEQVRG